MSWDYSDTYVAACLRCFRTHYEGKQHEQKCEECQRILLGIDEEDGENDDQITDHEDRRC